MELKAICQGNLLLKCNLFMLVHRSWLMVHSTWVG